MKYVFVVHSPIAYSMTKIIIKNYEINNDDVVIALYRDFNIYENEFQTIILPFFNLQLKFWNNWELQKDLDRSIRVALEGRKFIAYIPSYGFNAFFLLINSHYCDSFFYIEEGLASYFDGNERELFHSNNLKLHFNLKKILKYVLHILNFGLRNPYYKEFYNFNDKKYRGSFVLSDFSIIDAPNRIKLSFNCTHSFNLVDIKDLLILEPLVETKRVSENAYIQVIQEFLDFFLTKMNKRVLHYKFHPIQEQNGIGKTKKRILEVFSRYSQTITFFELDGFGSLEDLAFSNDNIRFYTTYSSGGLYAIMAGCKVYSYGKRLSELDANFNGFKSLVPAFYQKRLIDIL